MLRGVTPRRQAVEANSNACNPADFLPELQRPLPLWPEWNSAVRPLVNAFNKSPMLSDLSL